MHVPILLNNIRILEEENFELKEQLKSQNVIIDRFLKSAGLSEEISQPEDFEEAFKEIEQTFNEKKELSVTTLALKINIKRLEEQIGKALDMKDIK